MIKKRIIITIVEVMAKVNDNNETQIAKAQITEKRQCSKKAQGHPLASNLPRSQSNRALI